MAQTKITVDGITDLTSSATELNYVDITTLGAAQASKVLTTNATIDVASGLRNLTGTGFLQGGTLRTTVLEYTDGDDAITIADGGSITVAQNATFTGTVTTPSVLFKGSTNAITVDVNNGVAAYSVILPDAAPTANDQVLKVAGGSPYSQLVWGTITSSDTTYTHTWQDSGDDAILRLTAGGSGSGNDDLTLEAGSNITLTPSGDTLTIAASGGAMDINVMVESFLWAAGR